MKAFLTICFSILSLHIWSQQDTLMAGTGTGWNLNTLLDEFLSPMPYRGDGYMVGVFLMEQNDRLYEQLALVYQQGRISPGIDNHSAADLYGGSIGWIRTYRLRPETEKWMIYLGFHFFSSYQAVPHTQWPNNHYSHCLAFSLGPSLVIDHAPWQKNLHLGWELSIPALNYIIRPSLGSIIPEGSIRRSRQDLWGMLSGGRICSLHEYQRICSNLFVLFPVTARTAARAGYQWDFQNYTVNNHYQSAHHLIYLSIFYRFKK